MLMPPEHHDYLNNNLGQQLQRLITSIRIYLALHAVKSAELPNQASHLWELIQRYRLVKGKNEAASFALLSNCQETYQGMSNSILNLVEELDKVSIQVLELESKCLQLTKEQEESSENPVSLKELLDFLEESLKFLQNQTKYLELHLRQLHPKHAPGEAALEAFKDDLQLPDHVKAHLELGLAKIERFLKNP